MGQFTVIPTTYKNVKFRSKTEAKWAVFFDALGLPWEHEPEAFSDGQRGYLPDFWLPSLQLFWEVKGIGDFEKEKVEIATRASGFSVAVAVGEPTPINLPITEQSFQITIFSNSPVFKWNDEFGAPSLSGWAELGWDRFIALGQCLKCGAFGLARLVPNGDNDWVFAQDQWRTESSCSCIDPEVDLQTKKMASAYFVTRVHRFWDPK